MIEVSTSVLNVDKQEAMKTFYDLEVAKTDYFHIDVMDGKFVQNNTAELMYSYASTIKQISNIPLDVHLMVEDVKDYVNQYVDLKPHFITIHYEALKEKKQIKLILEYIKQNDIQCGISINPSTNIKEIYEFLSSVNLVQIMTVEPGKGGQTLIPETINKVRKLREYLYQNNIEPYISADGGINIGNSIELKEAGADIIVAGNSIIKSGNFENTIKELKK